MDKILLKFNIEVDFLNEFEHIGHSHKSQIIKEQWKTLKSHESFLFFA